MSKYDNVDYVIVPSMKTAKFITSDGETFDDTLSTVYAVSANKLQNMPENIAAGIAPGSRAYVMGTAEEWQKETSGSWKKLGS